MVNRMTPEAEKETQKAKSAPKFSSFLKGLTVLELVGTPNRRKAFWKSLSRLESTKVLFKELSIHLRRQDILSKIHKPENTGSGLRLSSLDTAIW